MKKKIKKSIGVLDWFSKLTEAEKDIWTLIYYHPVFIRNRTTALDMLFCVIGTGLKWKNGRIVDTVEDNYLSGNKQDRYDFDADIYKKAYRNTFWKDISMCSKLEANDIRRMAEYNYQNNCIAEYTLKNIEKAVTVSHVPKYFYSLCRYSNLMEVPKNVDSDWLELAIETCDLILVTDPLYKCSNGRMQNKDNIKMAKRQKIKLLKMKTKKLGKI